MGFQHSISSRVVEKRKANMSSIGCSTGDETERQIIVGDKNNFAFQKCTHFQTSSHLLDPHLCRISSKKILQEIIISVVVKF